MNSLQLEFPGEQKAERLIGNRRGRKFIHSGIIRCLVQSLTFEWPNKFDREGVSNKARNIIAHWNILHIFVWHNHTTLSKLARQKNDACQPKKGRRRRKNAHTHMYYNRTSRKRRHEKNSGNNMNCHIHKTKNERPPKKHGTTLISWAIDFFPVAVFVIYATFAYGIFLLSAHSFPIRLYAAPGKLRKKIEKRKRRTWGK